MRSCGMWCRRGEVCRFDQLIWRRRMRNWSLAVLSFGSIFLSSCEDKYVLSSRRAVSNMGVAGAQNYFSEQLSKDDGDTYYAYYIFVNRYSEFLKDKKFRDVQFQNNILSCSARFGSARGLTDAFQQLDESYRTTPFRERQRCTEIKNKSPENWIGCGGAELMEKTPCEDLKG